MKGGAIRTDQPFYGWRTSGGRFQSATAYDGDPTRHDGVVASKETFRVSGCRGPRWSKPACANLNKQTVTKMGNSCQFTWASCFKTCPYPKSTLGMSSTLMPLGIMAQKQEEPNAATVPPARDAHQVNVPGIWFPLVRTYISSVSAYFDSCSSVSRQGHKFTH